LSDSGVDVHIGYVSETASNVQGGAEELWRYADQ
jgi:carbohydrate-selective porin OprB